MWRRLLYYIVLCSLEQAVTTLPFALTLHLTLHYTLCSVFRHPPQLSLKSRTVLATEYPSYAPRGRTLSDRLGLLHLSHRLRAECSLKADKIAALILDV